jgi:hypothetical protein
LKCLVTLLHSEEWLLPIFEEGLLWHDDPLDFDGGFFESITSSCCFFLLRDKLGLVQSFLFV